MAVTVLKREPRRTAFRCPECGAHLEIQPDSVPEYAICPSCAAISIFEMVKRLYRMLKTQEWLDVVGKSGYWDLLEARQFVLDRITTPEPPNAHAEPPRTAQ